MKCQLRGGETEKLREPCHDYLLVQSPVEQRFATLPVVLQLGTLQLRTVVKVFFVMISIA